MSACGQFTDKNSHAPLEVAYRRLDAALQRNNLLITEMTLQDMGK